MKPAVGIVDIDADAFESKLVPCTMKEAKIFDQVNKHAQTQARRQASIAGKKEERIFHCPPLINIIIIVIYSYQFPNLCMFPPSSVSCNAIHPSLHLPPYSFLINFSKSGPTTLALFFKYLFCPPS